MPTPAHRIPLNTYRLQVHAGFTFADAAAQLDYLADLGVTDLYLSPILEAVPGSTHGYDVVDPTRISDERGGRAEFEALATAAHARGLGVVVDIVPNHMAIPTPLWLNPALWSVLRDGPDSPYARWFDIEPGAKLVLPVVAAVETDRAPDHVPGPEMPSPGASGAGFVSAQDPIPSLIAAGRLRIDDRDLPGGGSEQVLLLDDDPYPLAPGTEHLPLSEAVARQHYSLQRWQGDHTRLSHRRFFDIVTLIGLHQEVPEVFDATHALLLELFHAGHVDGFRVDHPDGLADPQAYFERLDAATGGAWVVAEKILSGDELLPTSWPVSGATGYEASWRFDAIQLDPRSAASLAELARRTDDQPARSWPQVATEAKRLIADGSLAIDVDRLVRLARQLDPSLRGEDLRVTLREFLVALDRYRAYVRPGHPTRPEDVAVLAAAAARARVGLPARLHPMLEWLRALAAGEHETGRPSGSPDGSAHPGRIAADEFVVRFQQVSGALVAKGVEDTAFYRWAQLLTLCEVGADPGILGTAVDQRTGSALSLVTSLHDWLGRVNAGWPATMSLGSTHDSKRSEDVRARIAAISEYPEEWAALVAGLSPLAEQLPPPIRTILWQTLAGTWTAEGPISADRIATYCVKAGREQKLWTSWVSPDEEQEATVAGAIPALLDDPRLRAAFGHWVELTGESVRTNTLATKLVQLTALGVADVYQGQETVRLSLTDPDNRRPVDFDTLHDLHAAITSHYLPNNPLGRHRWQPERVGGRKLESPAGEIPVVPGDQLSMEKLLLTTLALHLRQRHPDTFVGGAYLPLESTTAFAWGFARGDEPTAVSIATRLPRERRETGGWRPTDHLCLPPGTWLNLLTGSEHAEEFRPAGDLGGWPAALLERIG